MAKILITDVTRMNVPNVCIAGIWGTQQVRLNNPKPTDGLLTRLGGLRPGDIIDVDWKPSDNIVPPHTEDGVWDPNSIRKTGNRAYSSLRKLLALTAVDSIENAFGSPYVKGGGGNFAFQPNTGGQSLISLRARNIDVYLDYRDKVRVAFEDSSGAWREVALDDLNVRTHAITCASCKRSLLRNLSRDFDCAAAILRVGLGRPFDTPQHPLACWVQVNGIYPLDHEPAHFA